MGYSLKEPTSFFHKLDQNVPPLYLNHSLSSFKMYPEIWSSCAQPYTQWVLWEFVVKLNQIESLFWILLNEPPGYILKELLMEWLRHRVGTFLSHYERTHRVLLRVTSWVLWWVLLKPTNHLPTDPIKIKVVSKLRTCPPFALWVKCE